MTTPPRSAQFTAVTGFLGSAGVARAITTCAIGMAFLSHAIRSLIGWPGLVGMLLVLVLLASASLIARRGTLEWRGLLTVSLLAFVAWCAISVLWSDYQWATLSGSLYQAAIALLGIYIALLRDQIQIVRAFGDSLRALLGASLILEVLSGLLLDSPIKFLGITGGLGDGGPIQGLFGTRNQLGLVALIALVTFVVELLTRSVRRGISISSITVATLVILLTRSPVVIGTLAVTVVVALALVALRRLTPERRRIGEFVVSGTLIVALVSAWTARSQIIDALNAGSEFEYRYSIWKAILTLVNLNPLEGFGWLGYWRSQLPPYVGIDVQGGGSPSAFNAYLDVWVQVGLVGLALFIALLGLALVRSWLLAANKKSIVYLWPALVLVVLATTSAAESAILVESGWLILVICAVRGSEGLSWRNGLRDRDELDPARG